MTESALLPTDVGMALELLERAYAWEGEPLTPEKSQRLEILTERVVQHAAALQKVWPLCTREGSVWEAGHYLSRMRMVEFLAQTVADMLIRTEEIMASTRAQHPDWVAPSAAEHLQARRAATREIITQARELVTKLDGVRAPVNEDMLRRSRESLDRGEGEALNAILARVQNGGPVAQE